MSSYSQGLYPKKINFEGDEALLISFEMMDQIAFKLIDRNNLKKKYTTLSEINKNLNDQAFVLEKSIELKESQLNKWKGLYSKSTEQINIYKDQIDYYENTIVSIKKKHKRKSFVLFVVGMSAGASIFALLTN